MKLQINATGSWKNLTDFNAAGRSDVIAAVIQLDRALNAHLTTGRVSFCLVDDQGKREWLDKLSVVREQQR